MKLTIRTLGQKTISVELELTQSVLALKQILAIMPEVALPVESVQLIYAGRIMQDQQLLSSYNIKEDRFIVLMSKKAPVEEKDAEKPSPPPATKAVERTVEAPTVAPPSITPDEQHVRDLMSMGYNEQEARTALRASFNHPERAIEYLINGIPLNLSANGEQMPAAEAASAPASATAGNSSHLAFLAEDPRFQQVRDIIRHNPELLSVVLARISETDPAAYELIRNNQQEFIAILNGTAGDPSSSPNDSETLTLTTDEVAAVERLSALGFHPEMVVQVYLACDKDEELAADILFRQSEEEDH